MFLHVFICYVHILYCAKMAEFRPKLVVERGISHEKENIQRRSKYAFCDRNFAQRLNVKSTLIDFLHLSIPSRSSVSSMAIALPPVLSSL